MPVPIILLLGAASVGVAALGTATYYRLSANAPDVTIETAARVLARPVAAGASAAVTLDGSAASLDREPVEDRAVSRPKTAPADRADSIPPDAAPPDDVVTTTVPVIEPEPKPTVAAALAGGVSSRLPAALRRAAVSFGGTIAASGDGGTTRGLRSASSAGAVLIAGPAPSTPRQTVTELREAAPDVARPDPTRIEATLPEPPVRQPPKTVPPTADITSLAPQGITSLEPEGVADPADAPEAEVAKDGAARSEPQGIPPTPRGSDRSPVSRHLAAQPSVDQPFAAPPFAGPPGAEQTPRVVIFGDRRADTRDRSSTTPADVAVSSGPASSTAPDDDLPPVVKVPDDPIPLKARPPRATVQEPAATTRFGRREPAPASVPPSAPAATLVHDVETTADRLRITGVGRPRAMIAVSLNGTEIGRVEIDENEAFSLDLPARLLPGDYELVVLERPGAYRLPPSTTPRIIAFALDSALRRRRGVRFAKPTERPHVVVIEHGDTLWSVARRAYGSGASYPSIVRANRDLIDNPALIFPGQVFVLPRLGVSVTRL